MEIDLLRSLVTAASALLGFGLLGLVWLAIVVAWGDRRTLGLAYFGLPREGRERFRRRLRSHARILAPVIRLSLRAFPFRFDRASFAYRGIPGPKGTCTLESFDAGASYDPSPDDVFVVTQMRSGTTWMQNIVYEVLTRGGGDLVETGRTLNAISPWLEAVVGVPVGEAPPLGATRARLIKTHFPVALCPFSERAKYIYVVRDPVSCFASCVDFLADNTGPSKPPTDVFETWFCSPESMWWGSWPAHVEGWWSRSLREENVLFVRFEDMLADLPRVVSDLTAFLGVPPLDESEMNAVLSRTSFEYMRDHREAFEMYPPHVLASDSAYFTRGTVDRHRDVPEDARERILRWCRAELEGTFPLDEIYPHVDSLAAGGDRPPIRQASA